jgi:hypothetical protein
MGDSEHLSPRALMLAACVLTNIEYRQAGLAKEAVTTDTLTTEPLNLRRAIGSGIFLTVGLIAALSACKSSGNEVDQLVADAIAKTDAVITTTGSVDQPVAGVDVKTDTAVPPVGGVKKDPRLPFVIDSGGMNLRTSKRDGSRTVISPDVLYKEDIGSLPVAFTSSTEIIPTIDSESGLPDEQFHQNLASMLGLNPAKILGTDIGTINEHEGANKKEPFRTKNLWVDYLYTPPIKEQPPGPRLLYKAHIFQFRDGRSETVVEIYNPHSGENQGPIREYTMFQKRPGEKYRLKLINSRQ